MSETPPPAAPTRLTARALIVGERIDTAGLERPDMISALPLAFRVGTTGMVALFRFGVAVLVDRVQSRSPYAQRRCQSFGCERVGEDSASHHEECQR